MNQSKKKLVVDVAKMYHISNLSQKNIAEELNLSRAYVSNLLTIARKEGIIEIKINDPFNRRSELEESLLEMFSLNEVIIVPSVVDGFDAPLFRCVSALCKYLDSIIKSNMTIAFSWGYTIYSCSKQLKKRDDIKGVSVIPLCGGVSNLHKKVYVSEISQNISDAYNGLAYYIPLPSIVGDVAIKRAVLKDHVMNDVLEKAKNADIALFTTGTFGENSAIYNAGYISPEEMEHLNKKNVVGDICSRFIDINGDICAPDIDERTIAVDLESLSNIKYRICVALGKDKVAAMIGALRKGYPNVLITDEDTGKEIMQYCMKHGVKS